MSTSKLLAAIDQSNRRQGNLPVFRPGDSVKVWAKIREGDKTRLQAFEGVCIRRTRKGSRSTFTIRKISYGVGVERIFPDNSPNIDRIDVVQRGDVNQARLYYLRDLSGKAARIKERTEVREVAEAVTEGDDDAASDAPGEPKEKIKGRGKRKKKREAAAAAGA